MKIEFLGPAVPAHPKGISYRAKVDGEIVACIFSMETLQDVAPNLSLADSNTQFEASKNLLLSAAERKILRVGIHNNIVQIFNTDLNVAS